MTYTIKISDVQTEQSKSLLFFLKSLAQTTEYYFLKIEQDDDNILTDELIKELDSRYEHFLKNKDSYKDWDDIKTKYVKA